LVITGSIDVLRLPWLMTAIVLYLVAIGYAIFVQVPRAQRIIAMTTPPAGDSAPSAPPAGGPPPELVGLITQARRGGLLLIGLVSAIVFLMVLKPSV
jgi:hypothetical protein